MICPECFSKEYELTGVAPVICVCGACGHEEEQFSKTVYVCSPLRGNGQLAMEHHLQLAKDLSRWVKVEHRRIPITPHLYFTTFLDDDVPAERELGMAAGKALLRLVDEVYIFPLRGYISQGMQAEMEHLHAVGKPYRILDIPEEYLP